MTLNGHLEDQTHQVEVIIRHITPGNSLFMIDNETKLYYIRHLSDTDISPIQASLIQKSL